MGKYPIRAGEVAGVAVGDPFQVVLMFRLRLPEGSGRHHFGHHLARPQAGGVDVGDGVLGHPALLIVEVEDG